MSHNSLQLHLQSSHEALRESIQELQGALEQAEALEEDGERCPVPSGELERAIAQCQNLQRKLDQWRARM